MGFPKKNITGKPVMTSGTKTMKCVVYECPRCGALLSDVPSFCKVCNLMLASSAHLTRTAHHNNPVENYDVAQNVLYGHKIAAGEYINGNGAPNGETNGASTELVTCGGCDIQLQKSIEMSKFISICPR